MADEQAQTDEEGHCRSVPVSTVDSVDLRRFSLWLNNPQADFYLPPALTPDTLKYLEVGSRGAVAAMEARFGPEAVQAASSASVGGAQ